MKETVLKFFSVESPLWLFRVVVRVLRLIKLLWQLPWAKPHPRLEDRLQFIKHNPIFGKLFARSKHPTARLGLVLLSMCIAIGLVCRYEGCLFLPGRDVGLIEDPVFYTLIVLQLLMVFFVQRLFDSVVDLFDCTPEGNGLGRVVSRVGRSQILLEKERRRIFRFIGLKTPEAKDCFWVLFALWTMLTIAFQVIVPLCFPQPVRAWAIWPDQYPLSFAAGCVWAALVYSVVLCCLTWYMFSIGLVVFLFIYKLVKQGFIEVLPLSPDNRGGLACLGRTSFALSLVAIPGMLLVVAWIVVYGIDLPTKIGLPLYIVIVVSAFFGPLLSVHRGMREAKDKELKRLAQAFHARYQDFVAGLSGQQSAARVMDGTPALLNELTQVEQLYKRAEGMPVWPFDATTLRQFFTLILFPLAVFIFQWFTENALTKWSAGWLK